MGKKTVALLASLRCGSLSPVGGMDARSVTSAREQWQTPAEAVSLQCRPPDGLDEA